MSESDKPGQHELNLSTHTNVGGMDVAQSRGPGVLIEGIHWEHYARRVEAIDMPSLDEGNFLVGAASAFVSLLVAILGVAFGTENAAAWLYIVLGALLAASGALTLYFWRAYDRAKKALKKTGATICREMREVADEQKKRVGLTE